MGPVQAISICLRKYFDFSGRARRSEFWWFFTFVIVMGFVLSAIDAYLFPHPHNRFWINGDVQINLMSIGTNEFRESPLRETFGWLVWVPLIAVTIRRLHDRAHSAKWIVIPIIIIVSYPIIAILFGSIIPELLTYISLLMLICALAFLLSLPVKLMKDSERGENQYGISPKYPDEATDF